MITRTALLRGSVAWADLSPARGREQAGRRPVLVVASRGCLEAVTTLALVHPVTTTNRRWPNRVELTGRTGLDRPGWATTEPLRTIDRDRIEDVVGLADDATLARVDVFLKDFLGL